LSGPSSLVVSLFTWVSRILVSKAIASTTNATQSIFTVSGHVVLAGLIGIVTVAFDGTTTSLNVTHDPTIGSAVDLAAATVVTSDAAGTLYGILTARTGLLVSEGTSVPGTAYAPLNMSSPLVLAPGVIGHKGTATDAGAVTWYAVYWPLTNGASLVAA